MTLIGDAHVQRPTMKTVTKLTNLKSSLSERYHQPSKEWGENTGFYKDVASSQGSIVRFPDPLHWLLSEMKKSAGTIIRTSQFRHFHPNVAEHSQCGGALLFR